MSSNDVISDAAPDAPEELPPRPDATGALVPMRYVYESLGGTGLFKQRCQMLQIGAVAEPTSAEEVYAQALRSVVASLDAEKNLWRTECAPRLAASKHAAEGEWLLKRLRENKTREMRAYAVWNDWTGCCITARADGAYAALAAVGKRSAGTRTPTERRAQLAALLDALVAAREAAYPQAWVAALATLFCAK